MASNNDDLPDDLHADNDSVEIIWEAVFEDEESPPESEEEELEVKKKFLLYRRDGGSIRGLLFTTPKRYPHSHGALWEKSA